MESFRNRTIDDFMEILARDEPPLPGAGSATALSGAIAASLGIFVTRLTLRHEKDPGLIKDFRVILERFKYLQDKCLDIMHQDPTEYKKILTAFRMPKNTREESARRKAALEEASIAALGPPVSLIEYGTEILRMSRKLVEKGYGPAKADAEAAAEIAHACLCSGLRIARANFPGISDPEYYRKMLADFETEGEYYYEKLRDNKQETE